MLATLENAMYGTTEGLSAPHIHIAPSYPGSHVKWHVKSCYTLSRPVCSPRLSYVPVSCSVRLSCRCPVAQLSLSFSIAVFHFTSVPQHQHQPQNVYTIVAITTIKKCFWFSSIWASFPGGRVQPLYTGRAAAMFSVHIYASPGALFCSLLTVIHCLVYRRLQ